MTSSSSKPAAQRCADLPERVPEFDRMTAFGLSFRPTLQARSQSSFVTSAAPSNRAVSGPRVSHKPSI